MSMMCLGIVVPAPLADFLAAAIRARCVGRHARA